jgi:hypothetical protein
MNSPALVKHLADSNAEAIAAVCRKVMKGSWRQVYGEAYLATLDILRYYRTDKGGNPGGFIWARLPRQLRRQLWGRKSQTRRRQRLKGKLLGPFLEVKHRLKPRLVYTDSMFLDLREPENLSNDLLDYLKAEDFA